jgi:hypothetical protein
MTMRQAMDIYVGFDAVSRLGGWGYLNGMCLIEEIDEVKCVNIYSLGLII